MWRHGIVYAARAARRQRCPYIITTHGSLDRWSLARSRWKKRLSLRFLGTYDMLNRADGIQFTSAGELEEARVLKLRSEAFIISNGISVSAIRKCSRSELETLWSVCAGLRDRWPVVLWLGRFHRKKALDLAIEAFGLLKPEYPNAALLAAGLPDDDAYLREQRARVLRLGLTGSVFIVTEFTDEARMIPINVADLFILPSYEEGFSVAALEAMAAGLPAVVTDGCHLDHIEPEGAGVVAQASVASLALALGRMLALPKHELGRMGNRARALVMREHTWKRIGDQLEAMYERVMRK